MKQKKNLNLNSPTSTAKDATSCARPKWFFDRKTSLDDKAKAQMWISDEMCAFQLEMSEMRTFHSYGTKQRISTQIYVSILGIIEGYQ